MSCDSAAILGFPLETFLFLQDIKLFSHKVRENLQSQPKVTFFQIICFNICKIEYSKIKNVFSPPPGY